MNGGARPYVYPDSIRIHALHPYATVTGQPLLASLGESFPRPSSLLMWPHTPILTLLFAPKATDGVGRLRTLSLGIIHYISVFMHFCYCSACMCFMPYLVDGTEEVSADTMFSMCQVRKGFALLEHGAYVVVG